MTLLTAFLIAVIGLIPMMSGSTPTCAHETILAKGGVSMPNFLRWLAPATTSAAAPSFIPITHGEHRQG